MTKVINPKTGRAIQIGSATYNTLLNEYRLDNGVLVSHNSITQYLITINDLEESIAENNRDIAILKEQVAMMAESHKTMALIRKFNTIHSRLDRYVDFTYMAESKDYSYLHAFLSNRDNRDILISIFGYHTKDYNNEYHMLRYARNNFSHQTY